LRLMHVRLEKRLSDGMKNQHVAGGAHTKGSARLRSSSRPGSFGSNGLPG
jgi:hypothetical protein